MKISDLKTCLNLVGAIVLLVGLSTAVLIYRHAEIYSDDVIGYEQGYDGVTRPVLADDSKKYLRDLELHGGKAGVLMDKFRRWFVGLWHGQTLAFTVAFLTVLIAGGFFYAARSVQTD